MNYKHLTTDFKNIAVAGFLLIFSLFSAQTGLAFSEPDFLGGDSVSERISTEALEHANVTLEAMKNDPVLRNAEWGFAVYDPNAQKLILSYNEDLPLVPASTTKLLTTDTAYSLLGAHFRFDTQMEYSGEISEEGVLNGNLYIIGSGDPSLGINHAGAPSYWRMIENFRDIIKNAGIKKINGNMVIETAIFENENLLLPPNIVWKKHNNYYLPVGSTEELDSSKEKLVKKPSDFEKENRFYYISPSKNKPVYANEFTGKASLYGKIPPAPAYFAKLFRSSLLKNGISVGSIVTKTIDDQPEERQLLTIYKSPLLEDIIYFTNQTSNNRLAEEFMKLSGFYTFGDLSISSGRSAVEHHLEGVNFDSNGFVYIDGSGLSHSHRVTAIAQVKFLAGMMKRPYFDSFYQTLPIAGTTGTLKTMFVNNDETGKIIAKTGTLNGVKTLAGYINTSTGKQLTFSLLIKGYRGTVAQVKKKMEQILEPTIDL